MDRCDLQTSLGNQLQGAGRFLRPAIASDHQLDLGEPRLGQKVKGVVQLVGPEGSGRALHRGGRHGRNGRMTVTGAGAWSYPGLGRLGAGWEARVRPDARAVWS